MTNLQELDELSADDGYNIRGQLFKLRVNDVWHLILQHKYTMQQVHYATSEEATADLFHGVLVLQDEMPHIVDTHLEDLLTDAVPIICRELICKEEAEEVSSQ